MRRRPLGLTLRAGLPRPGWGLVGTSRLRLTRLRPGSGRRGLAGLPWLRAGGLAGVRLPSAGGWRLADAIGLGLAGLWLPWLGAGGLRLAVPGLAGLGASGLPSLRLVGPRLALGRLRPSRLSAGPRVPGLGAGELAGRWRALGVGLITAMLRHWSNLTRLRLRPTLLSRKAGRWRVRTTRLARRRRLAGVWLPLRRVGPSTGRRLASRLRPRGGRRPTRLVRFAVCAAASGGLFPVQGVGRREPARAFLRVQGRVQAGGVLFRLLT